MAQVLSLQISIPSIFICFTVGLSLMIFPINNEPTFWWNPFTILLWFIGIFWLVGMLIYRKQRINVYIDSCNLSRDNNGDYIAKLIVLVSARHPDILRKLELGMQPIFVLNDFSKITPKSIKSEAERFDIEYRFSSVVLNEPMQKQNNEFDIVLWLQATTLKAQWITDGFRQPIISNKESQVFHIGMSRRIGSLNLGTHKKEGIEHLGITHEQFNKILNKVSNKKSRITK